MSNFWDSKVDKAIQDFTETDNIKIKDKIYSKTIHPAFVSLINVYFTKYSIKKHQQDMFMKESLSNLWEILCRYKYPKTGQAKPFSYFFISVKQFWTSTFIRKKSIQHITDTFSGIHNPDDNALNTLLNLPQEEGNYLATMEAEDTKNIIINLIEEDLKSFKNESKIREKMLKAMIKYLQECPFEEMNNLENFCGKYKKTPSEIKKFNQMNDKSLQAILKKEFPKMSKQQLWNNLNRYRKQLKREYDKVKEK